MAGRAARGGATGAGAATAGAGVTGGGPGPRAAPGNYSPIQFVGSKLKLQTSNNIAINFIFRLLNLINIYYV